MSTGDPFEQLVAPLARSEPDPAFTRRLRARLVERLGLDDTTPSIPTIEFPERKPAMSTTETSTTSSTTDIDMTTTLVPYLAVAGGADALAWYAAAFGAVEVMRVVGDDGRIGHAELTIGGARFYLSDEYPDLGVHSPASLGGFTTTLHLTVADVDARFAQAVDAGASVVAEPADQPHGARHGAVVDPYGHRWILSQQLEHLSIGDYAARSAGTGFEVVGATPEERVANADRPGTGGGIWAGVHYRDALAGIRFLVDTFGFEEQLVVTGEDGTTVVHSQLRWPEGGIVQAGTYDPANVYTHAPGDQSLYVVTADPDAVWERCRAAGVDVVQAPSSPEYDPGGTNFGVRDPEGNIWTFGTYGLDA